MSTSITYFLQAGKCHKPSAKEPAHVIQHHLQSESRQMLHEHEQNDLLPPTFWRQAMSMHLSARYLVNETQQHTS